MTRGLSARPAGGDLSMLSLLCLAALPASACGTTSVVVPLERPEQHDAQDYSGQLERWTRHSRIIRELDTSLRVHATLLAPAFRSAYVARYAELFKLPASERDQLRDTLREEWRESYSFVVVVSTHDYEWNDFDQKDSIWRVSLFNDNAQEVKPSLVRRERRPTVTDKTLFPHLEEFYQLYRFRFPRVLANGQPLVGSDTEKLSLRLAGPLGHTDLVWRLK